MDKHSELFQSKTVNHEYPAPKNKAEESSDSSVYSGQNTHTVIQQTDKCTKLTSVGEAVQVIDTEPKKEHMKYEPSGLSTEIVNTKPRPTGEVMEYKPSALNSDAADSYWNSESCQDSQVSPDNTEETEKNGNYMENFGLGSCKSQRY